jgi:hypothetical protein
MPREVFVAGQILTAAEMNVVSDQTVMVFADAAARTTAIPSPTEGMVTYLSDVNRVEAYTGAAFVPVNTGFTARETITATDATWSVPSLGSSIVKVTVIGGGGGGGAANTTAGGAGGTTTFDAGGAGSITAAGGSGGLGGNISTIGLNGGAGFGSQNGGMGGGLKQGDAAAEGHTGVGGRITVSYLNLSGISTVNVTIGAGGSAGGSGGTAGGAGGRGEVIVEYVAG